MFLLRDTDSAEPSIATRRQQLTLWLCRTTEIFRTGESGPRRCHRGPPRRCRPHLIRRQTRAESGIQLQQKSPSPESAGLSPASLPAPSSWQADPIVDVRSHQPDEAEAECRVLCSSRTRSTMVFSLGANGSPWSMQTCLTCREPRTIEIVQFNDRFDKLSSRSRRRHTEAQ